MRPVKHSVSMQRPRFDSFTASAEESALQKLAAIGFTQYEAMAYLILLQDPPLTAYEVSKRGALTKASVYAALESLVRKGAVQPVNQHPLRYAPLDPERFFNQISRDMASLCRELAGALARGQRHKNHEYVWTLSSKQNIDEKIVEMIRNAKQQIWIKGPHHLLDRYVGPLKDASRRGVKILIILFGDKISAKRYRFGAKSKLYLHEGTGDMLAVGREQFVIATDFSDSLLANFGEHSEGAYTRSEAVVFMAETMIRHEVYLAEIIGEFGAAIEKRFGKALFSLRSKYLPTNLLGKVKTRLSSDTAGRGDSRS